MSKDLLTIREHEHKGIKVLVEIDRVNNKATLVEFKGANIQGYTAKEWLFEKRAIPYLKTWLNIFDAMKFATEEAIKDLEAVEGQKLVSTAKLVKAVSGRAHKIPIKYERQDSDAS